MKQLNRFLPRAAVLLNLGFFSTGCATIVNGTHDTVHVSSDPAGAVVTTGLMSQTTPCSLRLSRTMDHKLNIAKPGYETRAVYLHREFSNWVWGDILLVPLVVPIIVDGYSGGMWDIEPAAINVTLEPAQH